MSFGNRSGVNCTRWKAASIDLVRALASVVFPTSETCSIETKTPARMAIIKTSIVSPYASPVGWAPEVEDEMVKGVLKVVTEATGIEPA